MDDKLQDLYKAALMRHSREPRGQGKLENPSHEHFITNALCGDEVRLYLNVRDNQLESARFESQCCTICQASASILIERLEESSDITAATEEANELIAALRDKDAATPYPSEDDRSALFGVKAFSSRIRCATLPWEALLAALAGSVKSEE